MKGVVMQALCIVSHSIAGAEDTMSSGTSLLPSLCYCTLAINWLQQNHLLFLVFRCALCFDLFICIIYFSIVSSRRRLLAASHTTRRAKLWAHTRVFRNEERSLSVAAICHTHKCLYFFFGKYFHSFREKSHYRFFEPSISATGWVSECMCARFSLAGGGVAVVHVMENCARIQSSHPSKIQANAERLVNP